MKAITIAGRLTRDAELRTTNSGDRVASFSVAVDDRSGREKATLFFDCSLWGKRGEALAPHLTKGSSVTVSGDFGTREHEGKTYLTVRVNDVTLQGGGKPRDEHDQRPAGERRGGGGSEPAYHDLNDDIPFIRMAGVGDVG